MSNISKNDSKWIRSIRDMWFNLDAFFHIWVMRSHNGYSVWGELIHNGEEVVLSECFETEEECIYHINIILNISDENEMPEMKLDPKLLSTPGLSMLHNFKENP